MVELYSVQATGKDGRIYTNFYILVNGIKVPIRPVHWSFNDVLKDVAKASK